MHSSLELPNKIYYILDINFQRDLNIGLSLLVLSHTQFIKEFVLFKSLAYWLEEGFSFPQLQEPLLINWLHDYQ